MSTVCQRATEVQEYIPPLLALSGIVWSLYTYQVTKNQNDMLAGLGSTAMITFLVDSVLKNAKIFQCNLS